MKTLIALWIIPLIGELKAWMAAQGLSVLSEPVYGYFDPPWTPPLLRHNEVMLQTKADP